MTRNRILGLLLALAVLAGALVVALPESAQACPANEVTTTYYSSPAKTNVIGERTLHCYCGGISQWGSTSSYTTKSSYPCD